MYKEETLYKVSLDERAIAYALERLGHGNTLSDLLLRQIQTCEGRFVAALSRQVDERQIYDFSEGYQPRNVDERTRLEPILSGESLLTQYVNEFLCDSGRLCLFEDVSSKPNDPWVIDGSAPIWRYNDEVICPVFFKDRDDEGLLERVISQAWSWVLTGALIVADPSSQIVTVPSALSYDELARFAENTNEVVIGAYDYEGFILWQRENHSDQERSR